MNKQDFTRGAQWTLHSWNMFKKIFLNTINWFILSTLITICLINYYCIERTLWNTGFHYWKCKSLNSFGLSLHHEVTYFWEGVKYTSTLANVLNSLDFKNAYDALTVEIQLNSIFAVFVNVVLFGFVVSFFKIRGRQDQREQFVQGRLVVTPQELTKAIEEPSSFKIDGHALLTNHFEMQHLLIAGSTGSGKSVFIRKLLTWIRDRGDKAIIYDKGCTFVGAFYQPDTDVILNPFDQRCAAWDVWCDAHVDADFQHLAQTLIPAPNSGDPFWIQSARTLLASTCLALKNDPNRNIEKLLHLLLVGELRALHSRLEGTAGAPLTSDSIAKTASSIRSVLATYIKSLQYLVNLDTENSSFSIRDWVKDEAQNGFLFLSSHAKHHTSIRPLLSAWLDIASNAILSMPANSNRRVWVIMDEAPTLHKLPELPSTIAEVRKFGGCYVLGVQSYSQLAEIYGSYASDALLNNLNTQIHFRTTSEQMARTVSADLGECEVIVPSEQMSTGTQAQSDSVSRSQRIIRRPAVQPEELMMLENLSCWIRPLGNLPITNLTLKFDPIPTAAEGFIERPEVQTDPKFEVTAEQQPTHSDHDMGPELELELEIKRDFDRFKL